MTDTPITGIIDVRDNHWYVRTDGYNAGPHDAFVPSGMIERYGLRRGDTVTGTTRPDSRPGSDTRSDTRFGTRSDARPRSGPGPRPRTGRRPQLDPLVQLDTVNGLDPSEARRRPEFQQLTPLYPQERLRLETEPHLLLTRAIDLVMPIGKGQRALIVAAPKTGKTTVLQAIANAVTENNPECHLMVVLVDERPEEVTDMRRSVKGEVIASTFDRLPADHTALAELAIERAKRLVESGDDVVVLLDSITRLGRAYNLAAPASGRILTGGIDSSTLHLPKRFLGAARNIENGGSLTVVATALVETGSQGDTLIYEEYKSTGNAELRLDRKAADRRTFPAIDIESSGTRMDDLLFTPAERTAVLKLRRALQAVDPSHSIEQLLDQLRKTTSNAQFVRRLAAIS
jgi:transcription termination factor Rho